MDPARPLRDVFTDLAGDPGAPTGHDPAAVLAANGHPDLPDTLVAEAVVNYADTAPYEVAEHLAPYVMANSAVPPADPTAPETDPATWLDLLASAPDVAEFGPETADLDGSLDEAAFGGLAGDHDPAGTAAVAPVDAGFGDGGDSGTGATATNGTEDPTFADIATPHGDDALPDSETLDSAALADSAGVADWAAPSAPGPLGDDEADEGDIDDAGDLANG